MPRIFSAFLFLSLLAALPLQAQLADDGEGDLGLGTTEPDSSALLDMVSTDKGLLIPRMTSAQRDAIANPAPGLIIYNTDLNTIEFNIGSEGEPMWTSLLHTGNSTGDAWSLDGNATTGGEFLGTTTDQPLPFHTNNVETMRLDEDGQLGIGTASPETTLDADGGLAVRSSGTTIAVTTDGQEIEVGDRTYIKLSSDTSGYLRTITLTEGLVDGHIVVLQVEAGCNEFGDPSGPHGVEVEDVDVNPSSNVNLARWESGWNGSFVQNLDMRNGATLTLIWDADQENWMELAHANNDACNSEGQGEGAAFSDFEETMQEMEKMNRIMNEQMEQFRKLQGAQQMPQVQKSSETPEILRAD